MFLLLKLLLLLSFALGAVLNLEPVVYCVAPNGNDVGNTNESCALPFATIQNALNQAMPGDTIVVLPGTYDQTAITQRAGTLTHPIRVIITNPEITYTAFNRPLIVLAHPYVLVEPIESLQVITEPVYHIYLSLF